MLKVLIVDDETPIREWIAFCIQKSPEKYEIIGLASNGEEALEMINQHAPDVVFTDIKMPIMDGLELMKQIKLLNPLTEIVVLTCYSDFEYARQAVKYGATEYLLKTEIKDKDIMEILEKIKSKRLNAYENSGKEQSGIQLKREAFIKCVVMNKDNGPDISEKILQEQNIFLKGNSLFAMAVKYIDSTEFACQLNSCTELLQNDKIDNLIWFSYNHDIFVFLGNIKGTPSYLIQMNSLKDFALSMHRNMKCTIGLSGIYQGLKNLNTAVNEAVVQIKQEFYSGMGSVNLQNTSNQKPELVQQLEALKIQMFEKFKQGETDIAVEITDRILDFMEEWKINDVDYIKKVCIEIIEFISSNVYNNKNAGLSAVNHISEEILKTEMFQDLKKLLHTKVREIAYDDVQPAKSYSYSISKALEYIKNHFSEPIGLTDIATFVHLNPEYFSRLFKEETNKNFNNYLAEIRLNKAVNLLKNTDLRVNEIAQMVGYPNLSYFSTIFKKYLEVSPFNYRNKMNNN